MAMTPVRSSKPSRLILIVAMVAAPVAALAQGTGVSPTDLHRYPLPTYEEDWRALQTSDRTDVWDPVKFVRLSADGTASLSLGGELRVTYERFGNQSFGLTPPDPDGYFLQRYLLHTDLRAGSRVRVWTEFNSGLENGRFGGPRPVIDEDKLDLHQAFVDVGVAATSPSAAVLRVGRQEIALGAGRMYALREGPNVPLSFDGVRAIAHAGPWRLDGWAARPVDNTSGVFDDRSHHSFDVWGVYGSRVIAPSRQTVGLEVYYLGLARDAAHFDQGTANETRHTFGARVWHQGPWAYDAEAMFQVGRFGSGDIRAWRSVIEGSHLVADAVWLPRLGLVLDVASGDKNPADPNLQTFNALFQSGTYSGRAQLLGPSNSIRFEPSVTFGPARHMLVSAGWGFYWRQSADDALYSISGQVIVPSNGVTDRYEGSRPTMQIDWQLTRHLSAHVNYIYAFNGRFEEQSVHATPTMSYVSPWVTYRF
jgi:alginate export protein